MVIYWSKVRRPVYGAVKNWLLRVICENDLLHGHYKIHFIKIYAWIYYYYYNVYLALCASFTFLQFQCEDGFLSDQLAGLHSFANELIMKNHYYYYYVWLQKSSVPKKSLAF